MKTPVEELFWTKVNVLGPNDCWAWNRYCNAYGYGVFAVNRKPTLAHRVAWQLTNETEIPNGMCVLHNCDNPPCCNPKHLFIGTQLDNIQDRVNKNRNGHSTVCGEDHPGSKLTKDNVKEIRERLLSGETTIAIGKRFNVCHQTISNIKIGKTWRQNGE